MAKDRDFRKLDTLAQVEARRIAVGMVKSGHTRMEAAAVGGREPPLRRRARRGGRSVIGNLPVFARFYSATHSATACKVQGSVSVTGRWGHAKSQSPCIPRSSCSAL
jgi:hypothetical protein